MSGLSKQRERYSEAVLLSQEAASSLKPLHDDLAELSPTFDGIVYFAKDQWHKDNASAVATVQPESADNERFAFYKEKIEYRRVDLGATALGHGLRLDTPQLLQSRMNPSHHTTWTHRAVIDTTIVGGLQAAFNSSYGKVPASTDVLNAIWNKHENTVQEVAEAFTRFSHDVTSIGDTLELLAPATPNSLIASWDTRSSTSLALGKYGTLRNYLLDAKRLMSERSAPLNTHIHDTGDGQDMTFWLPENSATFDRANPEDVGVFGRTLVLPLIRRLIEVNGELNSEYADITPSINFAVGVGYVEHDLYDGRTSQEYWKNAKLLKTHPEDPVSFTNTARDILFPNT